MNASAEEYLQLVEDCENRAARMSEEDRSFIKSIDGQLRHGRGITDSQAYRLDMIWERATARG